MADNLDDEKKLVEIQKLKAEQEKIEIEKLKMRLEYDEAKREIDKNWWAKQKFRQHLVAFFLGLSVIGFYINYAVVPAYNLKSIQAETEIAKREKNILKLQAGLDSSNRSLTTREDNIRQLKVSLAALDSNSRIALDSAIKTSKSEVEQLAKANALLIRRNLAAQSLVTNFVKADEPLRAKKSVRCTFKFSSKFESGKIKELTETELKDIVLELYGNSYMDLIVVRYPFTVNLKAGTDFEYDLKRISSQTVLYSGSIRVPNRNNALIYLDFK